MFYGLTDAEKRLSFTLIRLKKNLQTINYINEGGDVTLTIVGRVRSGCWEASSSRSAKENKEFRFFLKNQNDSVIIQYIQLSSI